MASSEGSGPRTAAIRMALRASTIPTIAFATLGLAAGGFVGWNQADLEVAEATILINPLDGNPFSTTGRGDDLINMVTEAELIRSDSVAELVRDDLGTDESPAALLGGMRVRVPPNSQILQITYEAQSGDQAVKRAQSFADQYLAYRQDRAESLVQNRADRVEAQLEEHATEQAELAQELADADEGSNAAVVLEQQLDAVTSQVNQLRARATEIASMPVNPGQVVTSAAVVPKGLLGSWMVYPIAGLTAGLAAALALVLVRARLDNRIHHSDDISIIGHTLLGAVSAGESRAIESEMIAAPGLAKPTDAYRGLRVSILTAEHRRPLVILVATTSPLQGRPVTPPSLALTMATSRLDTVLVDAAGSVTRSPGSGGTPTVGLSDVLSSDGDPTGALAPLVPHGKVIRNNDPLSIEDSFMTPQMQRLMKSLRMQSDIVIVSAGTIRDSRTLALADSCDVVILEASAGVSTYADLLKTSDGLAAISEKLLGVILVTRSDDDATSEEGSERRRRKQERQSERTLVAQRVEDSRPTTSDAVPVSADD